jgi:hypothetical protein
MHRPYRRLNIWIKELAKREDHLVVSRKSPELEELSTTKSLITIINNSTIFHVINIDEVWKNATLVSVNIALTASQVVQSTTRNLLRTN